MLEVKKNNQGFEVTISHKHLSDTFSKTVKSFDEMMSDETLEEIVNWLCYMYEDPEVGLSYYSDILNDISILQYSIIWD